MASGTALIRLDDGSEKILGHPAEDVRARMWTGRSLDELVKDGRVSYGYELVCAACGKVAMYRREELGLRTRRGSYISQLVHRPSDTEASRVTCKACGKKAVRGMKRLEGLICPKCGRNTQSMDVGGIS